MHFRNYFLIFPALLVSLSVAFAKPGKTAVGIVIDPVTETAVSESLDAYAAAIERDGKRVFRLVFSPETDPAVIRDTLCYLHGHEQLEGAVLIGDIPVPMIRRAHHLATAFKMNPAMRRDASSIPSDRFYDDFSLRFDYLDRDGALVYYDLSPEGAQRIECDIYTARIKPASTDPDHSVTELIAEFLDKAAAAHAAPERVDHVFHFGGHGNSSESFNARIDENRAYYEMFNLQTPHGKVDYINFDEDKYVRDRLQRILTLEDIDIAHLHTHGAVGAQLISKEPYAFMTQDHLESAKQFFRARMRRAKDKDAARKSLIESYDIPASWLDNYDDPAIVAADSIRSASVDLVLKDLDGFISGPKLILLDACFNGAFLRDDYVAARYAFGHGSHTLAVTANSVNIIQDHWKNELIGLLGQGVCIGNWVKQIQTLESHLFGDPTYRFACDGKSRDYDVAFPTLKGARKMLGDPDPSVCGFGLRYLWKHRVLPAAQLSAYLENDPRMNVRMEVLASVVRYPYDYGALVRVLRCSLDDSYELIRRMAARYANICGDPALEEARKKALENPLVTARVRSHLMGSLYGVNDGKDAEEIADTTLTVKERLSAIGAQRNKCAPAAAAPMLDVLADPASDRALRIKAAEALGWYVLSVHRDEIYGRCRQICNTETDPEVKDELTRTLARLEDNAYCRR